MNDNKIIRAKICNIEHNITFLLNLDTNTVFQTHENIQWTIGEIYLLELQDFILKDELNYSFKIKRFELDSTTYLEHLNFEFTKVIVIFKTIQEPIKTRGSDYLITIEIFDPTKFIKLRVFYKQEEYINFEANQVYIITHIKLSDKYHDIAIVRNIKDIKRCSLKSFEKSLKTQYIIKYCNNKYYEEYNNENVINYNYYCETIVGIILFKKIYETATILTLSTDKKRIFVKILIKIPLKIGGCYKLINVKKIHDGLYEQIAETKIIREQSKLITNHKNISICPYNNELEYDVALHNKMHTATTLTYLVYIESIVVNINNNNIIRLIKLSNSKIPYSILKDHYDILVYYNLICGDVVNNKYPINVIINDEKHEIYGIVVDVLMIEHKNKIQ